MTDEIDKALDNLQRAKEHKPKGYVKGSDVLANKARRYGERVARERDLEIDLSLISWRFSKRMTRSRGRCKHKENGSCEIVLSRHEYDNHGWDDVKETIRHELIHVWQYQTFGTGDHGSTFRGMMDKMDVESITADSPSTDHKYEIVCPNCGVLGVRMVRSKIVKHASRYRCRDCRSNLESRRA